ncbi:MAG: DUF3592 domain-containing protein [Rhodanobacteraceae bacterium]|nr:DUF3592 domain-containing protein [Rhodanobacteraceae bacterium]
MSGTPPARQSGSQPPPAPLMGRLAPWFATVFGVLLLAIGALLAWEGFASFGWPEAQGTVSGHRIVREYQHRSNRQPEYHGEILYRYSVNGRPYSGDRYAIGRGSNATGGFPTRSEASKSAAEKFARDSQVAVYYNPDKPADAVLRRGADWTTGIPTLMGLLSIAGAVWLFRFQARLASG